MGFGVIVMLMQYPSVVLHIDVARNLSQGLLSFLPSLLVLYAMCARPLPTKHTLSEAKACLEE